MIFSRLRQVLPGLLLLSAITATAQANVILDGAHLLQQDGSGTYGGSIWSTTGCCASAVLGVGTTPGSATNINTGNGDLNYTLLNGITHFVLSGQTGYSVPLPAYSGGR
jgi:hypothetical protein